MDIFPVRMEVDWEELGSGKIVIVVKKDLSSVEEKVANFLGAPKTVRRPLDEMNSKLWLLMDGKMSVDQIVSEMDRVFREKIAPVNERVNRSIADFVNLGLVELRMNGSDIEAE
ncbi:MAG: hypothetical protein QF736_03790 [Candidatus Thalassarchaeaceae archaeon]|nr:hypothetical protein [Candidatus Thalassarchaeaceae archaeon]